MFAHRAALAALILSASTGLCLADDNAPAPQQHATDAHRPCAPETRVPGQETLSDKLDDCSGVLRPSVGMDPKINVPAPDPHPGDMPIIRPDPDVKAE